MNERAIIETSPKKNPPELPKDIRKKESRKLPLVSINEIFKNIRDKCPKTEMKKYGYGRNYVIILPEAWEELKLMIGWGKKTPTNVFEQLYQGMGYYFKNANRKTILVISHFLYIYAANRSPVSACISNGVHDSIMNRLEYERGIYCENEKKYNKLPNGKVYNPFVDEFGCSEVNLYGHTHPDIGVFFSHDDRNSGYATPNMPAAIFVADPIRKQLKAMVGVEQEEAQIIVCEYSNEIAIDNMKEDSFEKVRYVNKIIKRNRFYKEQTKEELITELGKTCNELLNTCYGSKGKYEVSTTVTGKEHIKVDIKISSNKAAKRKKMMSFALDNEDET